MNSYPLHIALQEGFVGDAVAITVNAQEVFRRQRVQTRWQIGYAEAIDVQVPAGLVTIHIEVVSKQIVSELRVQVERPTYLGVSLTPDDTITCRVSPEPFGYL